MRKNISTADRILRAILGTGALALVFFGPQTSWGYIGLIALITALSGFCPIYRFFRLDSHSQPRS